VRFAISVHSGSGAPGDAIERLAAGLGRVREGTRFATRGTQIIATPDEDAGGLREGSEREEMGRLALLEQIGEVCERTPDLKLDWYAVRPQRL
jgi:hypothetical protein